MNDRAVRAENYRNKAEEVRIIAQSLQDPLARETLMGVAADYTRLAMLLERTSIADPLPASEDFDL